MSQPRGVLDRIMGTVKPKKTRKPEQKNKPPPKFVGQLPLWKPHSMSEMQWEALLAQHQQFEDYRCEVNGWPIPNRKRATVSPLDLWTPSAAAIEYRKITRKKAAGAAAGAAESLHLERVEHDLALKTIKALDDIDRYCHPNFGEVSDAAAGAAASPAAGNKSLSLIEKAREEVLKRAHAMSPGLAEHLQRCERFHQLKETPSRSKPQKCEVCNTRDALEKIGSSHEYLWHCQECLRNPVRVNYYD